MNINLNDNHQKQEIPLDHKRLEAGLLGKIFGTGANAANNIAGLILFGLLIVMFIVWIIDPDKGLKFITAAVPVMTLALGYLFGKQT